MLKKMVLILFLLALISLPIFGDEQRDAPALQSLVSYQSQIESELAVLKMNYTEAHPEIRAKRKELDVVKTEIGKLQLYDQTALAKAGTKYAELLLKKMHAIANLANLQTKYTNTHPDVIKQTTIIKSLMQELETILPLPVQEKNESPKEPPKNEVKMFEIKHKTPSIVAQAITALGSGRPTSRIDPNDQLRTITVRDLPENIAVMQAALERLDKPDPAPVSIQTQIYLIAASDEAGDQVAIPKELEPVITQLKATLKYKNYRFVNTFINRVNDGGNMESTGHTGSTNGLPHPTTMQCRMSQVRLATDNQGKEAIRIGKFNFGLRVPIQFGQNNVQYQDVGITTELSLSEGGLAVVGTGNMGSGDGAMVVVVSAKKVK